MYRDGLYHAGKMYILHLYGMLSMLALPLRLMSQQVEFISQLLVLTT